MTYGPFQTKEAGDTIMKFTQDEVFPCVHNIRKLAIKTSQFHIGFWDSFFRKEISKLENEYKKESVEFIKVYHKWSTPDILFKELNIDSKDKIRHGNVMADYFNAQQAIMWHFNEGFRLSGYINKILSEQSTAAYNRVSITLALLAITISIIVAILK